MALQSNPGRLLRGQHDSGAIQEDELLLQGSVDEYSDEDNLAAEKVDQDEVPRTSTPGGRSGSSPGPALAR